jgi:hypothetical protein
MPLLVHAGRDTDLNPGHHLAPAEVAVLARYQVARYGAHHVIWDFVAEADFHADAESWRHVGRKVFEGVPRHPVTMHPYGREWVLEEFAGEAWMDLLGYQSAHRDEDDHWRFILEGPPSHDWQLEPARPIINLEPPYEGHLGQATGARFDDFLVRRASIWSLLSVPPAGVAYGSHGVWSWSDGSAPPMAHPTTGTPEPWQQALQAPGATQLGKLVELFESLDWWRLRPAPELIAFQPGRHDVTKTVVASRSEGGEIAVVYIPGPEEVVLDLGSLVHPLRLWWYDPRNAERHEASTGIAAAAGRRHLKPPGQGDWVLVADGR